MLLMKPYNRERAVEYARRWALSRNPLFTDFSGLGGNCTNFVSQCVYAGCCKMNYTPTFGWYYVSADDRSPSWTGVEFFYDFFTTNEGEGPFADVIRRRQLSPGDVIQLADASGDFYHSLIVSAINGAEILVCSHSVDSLDRPLSSYNYASARYLRILGARVEVGDECFDGLIEGTSLQ